MRITSEAFVTTISAGASVIDAETESASSFGRLSSASLFMSEGTFFVSFQPFVISLD